MVDMPTVRNTLNLLYPQFLSDNLEQRGFNAHDMGFDAPPDADDEAASYAPAHYLEDHSQDPALTVENNQFDNLQVDQLRSALKVLDERSLTILQARFLNEDNKATLHELADQFQVSAERIRQLEKNALKKLKLAMVA